MFKILANVSNNSKPDIQSLSLNEIAMFYIFPYSMRFNSF